MMAAAEHVTFALSGQLWAVDAIAVREVVQAPELLRVPHAPAEVAGVVGLRGDVLPVLDAHAVLGMVRSAGAGTAAVLVLESGSQTFGLAVDHVLDVVALPAAPAAPTGSRPRTSTGADGRLFQLLDVAVIAASTERSAVR